MDFLLATITDVEPRTVSSLPQAPPSPIGPLLSDTLSRLLPEDISLETYNSQYLQKSTSPLAVLAAATVSRILGSSREEVENTVFATLEAPTQLDIKVSLAALTFTLGLLSIPLVSLLFRLFHSSQKSIRLVKMISRRLVTPNLRCPRCSRHRTNLTACEKMPQRVRVVGKARK